MSDGYATIFADYSTLEDVLAELAQRGWRLEHPYRGPFVARLDGAGEQEFVTQRDFLASLKSLSAGTEITFQVWKSEAADLVISQATVAGDRFGIEGRIADSTFYFDGIPSAEQAELADALYSAVSTNAAATGALIVDHAGTTAEIEWTADRLLSDVVTAPLDLCLVGSRFYRSWPAEVLSGWTVDRRSPGLRRAPGQFR